MRQKTLQYLRRNLHAVSLNQLGKGYLPESSDPQAAKNKNYFFSSHPSSFSPHPSEFQQEFELKYSPCHKFSVLAAQSFEG